ncbi:hypothetical protein [Halobellus rubicundus]|uniref:Uncharacterized protein n=1 Tax=Halobellus rubicundus TaxID=2996466 RepID=A0ABD5M840_9EURY
MVWAEEYPETTKEIEDQLKALGPQLEESLLESCAYIADERESKLEELAGKQGINPDPSGEYVPQAISFIHRVEDSKRNKVGEIEELLNHNYDFEMTELKRNLARSIVGLLILKNGSDEKPDSPIDVFRQEAGLKT